MSPLESIHTFISFLQNGSTALHAAVMSGDLRAVLLLLGANADPTLPNKVGHLDSADEVTNGQNI